MLLAMAFFTGCMVTGMQNGINAGAGVIYPTALRANGVGYVLGVPDVLDQLRAHCSAACCRA